MTQSEHREMARAIVEATNSCDKPACFLCPNCDQQLEDALTTSYANLEARVRREERETVWKKAFEIAKKPAADAKRRFNNGNDYTSVEFLNGMIKASTDIVHDLEVENG